MISAQPLSRSKAEFTIEISYNLGYFHCEVSGSQIFVRIPPKVPQVSLINNYKYFVLFIIIYELES